MQAAKILHLISYHIIQTNLFPFFFLFSSSILSPIIIHSWRTLPLSLHRASDFGPWSLLMVNPHCHHFPVLIEYSDIKRKREKCNPKMTPFFTNLSFFSFLHCSLLLCLQLQRLSPSLSNPSQIKSHQTHSFPLNISRVPFFFLLL